MTDLPDPDTLKGLMADATPGPWTKWHDQRPPNERGNFRWKMPFDQNGVTVTPEWTDKLHLCGMGYAEDEWWPVFSNWDGYRRSLPKGIMWRPLTEAEAEAVAACETDWQFRRHCDETIVWGGIDFLPSPHSGRAPVVTYHRRYVAAPPYHAERFTLTSWMVNYNAVSIVRLAEAWNKRTPPLAARVIELEAEVANLRDAIHAATDPDFIWGAMDNVFDMDSEFDDLAAAASRAIRAALGDRT